MQQQSGWIDRRGAARTVPMKVLVLGYCRTGTSSMRTALQMLGYSEIYHMQSVLGNPLEAAMWQEAMDAKFLGKGKKYGRAEWDQLLGHCQAVTDAPAMLFSEDLIAAYPDAKVILTNRDPDKWWKSYDESLGGMLRSQTFPVTEWLDPQHFGKVIPVARRSAHLAFNCDPRTVKKEDAKACFVAHYKNVRHMVPEERLLEYRVGEGWGRLCEFLGDEVPEVDFPRTNDTRAILEMMGAWTARIARRTAIRALLPVAVLASIGLAIYTRRG
ncbi:P-loop containing nucleoside triphosphate hydrolase protein [Mycena rebaudengoi]|nr:P-loop containing nucleoside triphosphate hydrolase protein [Mycena rebaudengoi]KAJ7238983.1 P-loop containing nucleoside triphosphate hydrolase protein [Mycena rebaudengoi]